MSSNTGDVLQEFQKLDRALDRLSAVDLAALSDATLIQSMRTLWPLICRVQAFQHRVVGAIHGRGAGRVEGAVSTAAWLRNRLRMPEATVVVRTAAALDSLPEVSAAFAAGQLSDAHVTAIVTAAKDISPAALAGGAEKLLVEQALELAPSRFIAAAVRIRDQLDPEAADRRRRERLESRWLSVARTFDGCVSVSGLLDPDAGEQLITTLAALSPPPRPEDGRSAATRRADALLDLCRLGANHAPTSGGAKPHVLVTVNLADLQTRLVMTGSKRRNNPLWTKEPNACPGGSATLGSGWPVGAEAARRLACDAAIVPLVVGSASEPLDVGRLTRTPPPGLRRALVYRDGGCRFPFCDRPAEWTDAHHIIHWADGGPTALWNLVLLCRAHHVQVHEHGWILRLDATSGRLNVQHPHGPLLAATHAADRSGTVGSGGAQIMKNEADDGSAGNTSTRQHSTGQGSTGQDSTGQDSTGQDSTRQDSTRQGSTGNAGAVELTADGSYATYPRGAVPLRGAPPGTVHRSSHSCG